METDPGTLLVPGRAVLKALMTEEGPGSRTGSGTPAASLSSCSRAFSMAWLKEFWKLGTGTRSDPSLSPSLSAAGGASSLSAAHARGREGGRVTKPRTPTKDERGCYTAIYPLEPPGVQRLPWLSRPAASVQDKRRRGRRSKSSSGGVFLSQTHLSKRQAVGVLLQAAHTGGHTLTCQDRKYRPICERKKGIAFSLH